jgi:RimJ/RimL family protein N-acetyltransferase
MRMGSVYFVKRPIGGLARSVACRPVYPTLESERLVLRPLTVDDLDELAALHAQPSFWWYPFRRGWTREETRAFLERTIAAYDDPGVSVSAVVVRNTGQLAGYAGLAIPTFLPEVLPAVEVGWRLGEQFRRRGFATEAGAAWIRHGFEGLGLDEIVSIYEPDNEASGAVMHRLGFEFAKALEHPRLGITVHVLALTRARWSASRAPVREK